MSTPQVTDPLFQALARFQLSAFRPHQEAICRGIVAGDDALIVMPTGAGKSLCYQLPSLVRGGTALVISPLIALMEDQVAKLEHWGLRAERIHSKMDRLAARQVCFDYRDGRLDFLYIAPERLNVPGFPAFLAKYPPSLIAIDEAHCISQWGHDFRPDYRLLSHHLQQLRPAPIVAVTATATAQVQADIVKQLGLSGPNRHIHGFRRDNLAIEVVETPRNERAAIIQNLVANPQNRPAIVYTTARKDTQPLAAELSRVCKAAAYDAGMSGERRELVQRQFLNGDLEVIVATVAFGMGIDKPNIRLVVHNTMPGNLESYYQEIGRAGRDGLQSRAVMLFSFSDRRVHEFFLDKGYPHPRFLQQLFDALHTEAQSRETLWRYLQAGFQGDEDIFNQTLNKLIALGAARKAGWEDLLKGDDGWQTDYESQQQLRKRQLDDIFDFAHTQRCRMQQLTQYFGETTAPCGICDVCAPQKCALRQFREPSSTEQRAATFILRTLESHESLSTKSLYDKLSAISDLDRPQCEQLLQSLAAKNWIELRQERFTDKQTGNLVTYQRAFLQVNPAECNVNLLRLPSKKAVAPKSRGPSRSLPAGGRSRR